MSPLSPLLEAPRLIQVVSRRAALDRVGLHVNAGEVLAVVGEERRRQISSVLATVT